MTAMAMNNESERKRLRCNLKYYRANRSDRPRTKEIWSEQSVPPRLRFQLSTSRIHVGKVTA
jgi:hypothetical protein